MTKRSKNTSPPNVSVRNEPDHPPIEDGSSDELSSVPSSAELLDDEKQVRVNRIAVVRAEWKLDKMIENAIKEEPVRRRLTLFFTNDAAWSEQTIRAFEILAKPVLKGERDAFLGSLGKNLYSRCKAHNIDNKKAPPFGDTDMQKDMSVRVEAKRVIKTLGKDFEDSEAEKPHHVTCPPL